MIYLSPYIGTGTHLDPYRPKYTDPGWTAIDMRLDPTLPVGFCFLDIPERTEPDLILLGSDETVTLRTAQKIQVTQALGIDVSGVTNLGDLLEFVLCNPHAGREFVRGSSRTKIQEVYLQHRRIVSKFDPTRSNVRGTLDPTDNFNRADENPITGNWTAPNTNKPQLIGTEIGGNSAGDGDAFAFWNADAFANDQYSQFVFITDAIDSDGGPATRVQNTAALNGYFCDSFTGGEAILKFVAGSSSTIASTALTDIAASDVFRMEVEGSTCRYIINTVEQMSGTDTSFTSGSAGVFFFRSAYRADDWEGADIGAAVASLVAPRRFMGGLIGR